MLTIEIDAGLSAAGARRCAEGADMDGARFDKLTRQFAGGRTRRSLLRGLAGLAAGAAGLRATGGAAACPTGQVAASGGRCVCKATMRPPGPTGCPAGPGQTLCNGVAVDLSSD